MLADPHPVWHALQQHTLRSLPEYIAIFGLFLVAVIGNMPHPVVVQKLLGDSKTAVVLGVLYKWLYDSLQSFMLSRHPTPSQPSPPAWNAKDGATVLPDPLPEPVLEPPTRPTPQPVAPEHVPQRLPAEVEPS